ncbi:uncharacterized protein LOC134536786 [Bacillus rossius redtenbacheri]|uniref:uncharacterized protein LOC134536786 n=1 Tax=Bacillus rossius redtenbacheri TaxID=93214 RepID=UPI002FDEB029
MDMKDSDSDVSDGWSMVDAAVPSESGSAKDVSDNESVNCNASDGESLEIIQEEDDERKQFIESVPDVDNDCFSVISNCSSMVMENAAADSIEWNTSKLQTYVHRRNGLLNARLNFIVVVAVAAVAGLGIGHFIGSQENCPSLPNNMPDIPLVPIDRTFPKNSKLDLSSYHEPLISNFLKAKGIVHTQNNDKMLKDSVLSKDHKVSEEECFSDQKPINNFCNQNHNNDDSKTDTRKKVEMSCDDSEKRICIERSGGEAVARECENSMEHTHLEGATTLLQEKLLHQDSKGSVMSEVVNLENVVQNIIINADSYSDTEEGQKDGVKFDFKDRGGEKTELKHTDDQNLYGKFSEEDSDGTPMAVVLSQDTSMPQEELLLQKWQDRVSAKEDTQKNVLDKTSKTVVIVKDALDDSFIQVDSDYETTVGSDEITDPDCDDLNVRREEEVLQQFVGESDAHFTVHHGEATAESENKIPDQLPWLKRFYDTFQHLYSQGDKKLFSVVDLLTSLKQSIVELDETIVTNESPKFLKNMKMSVNKMKETMERIQKDVSFWSMKTTEKIHHRLLKLKSKVQEKWCALKDQYQHQNTDMFGWLNNNLFQGCRKDENIHSIKFSSENMGPTILGSVNSVEQTHPSLGKTREKKQTQIKFDKGDDGNYEATREKSEGSALDNKFEGKGLGPDSYGYATDTPESATRDFRKGSKGAFDKLRHHSTKCSPHCKLESEKGHREDPAEKWTLARKVAAGWKDSSNVSGIWMLRMSQGRAESRRNGQKSDWLFERARARKLRRDTDHERTGWFFERAQRRDNCRLNPQSDWCLGMKRSEQGQNKYSYDHFDNDDDEDEDEEDDDNKQHEYFRPKFWSKKIPSAPFAKTGKWLKNTVKEFKQKMNYYQYNQHKFHYV